MPQSELRRRRTQLEKLAQMRERAIQDGDVERQARIEASYHETEQRIAELESEASTGESGERRRRRG